MQAALIPVQMIEAQRWLLWKGQQRASGGKPSKVPYYVNGKQRGRKIKLDSPEDLAQLVSYGEVQAAFEAGGYSGIGFALGPDGTGNYWQGIDLDEIEAAGLQQVAEALLGYVEGSPSGLGLHGIGYGRAFKTLGANRSGIEAYWRARYFTVTGLSVRGKLCCLADFVEQLLTPIHSGSFHSAHSTIEPQESQDSQESQESQAIEEVGRDWAKQLPEKCRPTAIGQRNRVLFDLARHLKTKHSNASQKQMLPFVEAWHQAYLPVVGTKRWRDTWTDFCIAWRRVRFLEGEGLIDQIFESIDMSTPIPQYLQELGYDRDLFNVVELCRLLAMNNQTDKETFFLGGRALAELIGTSQPTAGNILSNLVEDGVLELLKSGRLEKGKPPRASVYKFIGVSK
jgi:hypothetical protein